MQHKFINKCTQRVIHINLIAFKFQKIDETIFIHNYNKLQQ
jgi:hypothetical protein